MTPPDTPLSPAELDELETFLNADDAPESAMDVSTEPMYWRAVQWGAAEWCEGFLRGTRFSDAWPLLWVARPTLATPLLRLGTDEGVELLRKAGDAQDWMDAAEPALVEIHAFWLERRASAPPSGLPQLKSRHAPVTRDVPKVGRNVACPCGSGMKFKKCCVASGATWH
jgi:uncharacterized protein